jgi:CcmD family protein
MPDQAAETPEESRSQAFVAVEGAVAEDIEGGPLMLTAYAIIWVLMLAYVFRLAHLHNKTSVELTRLSKVLSQASDKPSVTSDSVGQ